jgi:hypothetical protein
MLKNVGPLLCAMKKLKKGQIWFRGLTQAQKNSYIKKKSAEKRAKRHEAQMLLMKKYPKKYNCKKCIHKLSGSCSQPTNCGCQYFYDAINNIKFEKKSVKRHRVKKCTRQHPNTPHTDTI